MNFICANPQNMTPPWTAEHSAAAQAEGWDIFECFGSSYGSWQVQNLDESGKLTNDDDAWKIVGAQTKPHHVAAIAFLRAHNPQEITAFQSYIKEQPVVLRYRLAQVGDLVVAVNNVQEHDTVAKYARFVKWISDWLEQAA